MENREEITISVQPSVKRRRQKGELINPKLINTSPVPILLNGLITVKAAAQEKAQRWGDLGKTNI